MSKKEIEKILQQYTSNSSLTISEEKSSYKVIAEKSSIKLALTIPCDVTELYFEAESIKDDSQLKDWRDYYGSTEEQDFKEDLEELLEILNTRKFRFSNSGKTIEYLDNDWNYLFGLHKEKKYS